MKGIKFRAQVRKSGEIAIPASEREYCGINGGDWVAVQLSKLPTKEARDDVSEKTESIIDEFVNLDEMVDKLTEIDGIMDVLQLIEGVAKGVRDGLNTTGLVEKLTEKKKESDELAKLKKENEDLQMERFELRNQIEEMEQEMDSKMPAKDDGDED